MTFRPDLLSFARPILINLPHRTDRLADSLAELRWVAGRPVEPGVDLEVLRPTELTEANGFINANYRNCLISHLRAARWGRENGVERLLVLEDDIQFERRWPAEGPAALSELNDLDWDIANLGYLGTVDPDGNRVTRASTVWHRFTGEVIGSHAYLVNGRFFDTWITHLEAIAVGEAGDRLRGPMSPDGALNTMTWVEPTTARYVAVPSLVNQRPSRSDVNTGLLDRMPGIAWGVSRMRAGRQLVRRR